MTVNWPSAVPAEDLERLNKYVSCQWYVVRCHWSVASELCIQAKGHCPLVAVTELLNKKQLTETSCKQPKARIN